MRKQTNQILLVAALSFVVSCGQAASDVFGSMAPVVRGPGISQDAIEAYAEAQGVSTLAEHLETARPGESAASQLRKLVERAQTAWLAGSVDTARGVFREITRLSLEADWREPQREAIHYAFIRLAQSAATPTEKEEWLERAVSTFPDLEIDADLFPPPVIQAFSSARKRLLAQAKSYAPFEHFPETRFLLINGKRFVLTPELRVRLPLALYRITALSDRFPPMTERLSRTQLDVFRVAMPAVAAGNCEQPAAQPISGVEQINIVYSTECSRVRTNAGWQMKLPSPEVGSPSATNLDMPLEAPKPLVSKRTWLWTGAAVIATGVVVAIVRQQQQQKREEHPGETRVTPASRRGF